MRLSVTDVGEEALGTTMEGKVGERIMGGEEVEDGSPAASVGSLGASSLSEMA